MFTPRCTLGDFIVEVRSVSSSAHSVGSSYWIRQVATRELPARGPYATLPDASRVALALAGRAGTLVWRRVAVYLEDGQEPSLELIGPPAGGVPDDSSRRRGNSSA